MANHVSTHYEPDRPIVEETNVEAPTFARIFKEMIIVADQDRPLVRAPKGTVIRKLTLDLYASEIDAVYALFALLPLFMEC